MSDAHYEKVIDLWKAGKTQEASEYFFKIVSKEGFSEEEMKSLLKIVPNLEEYLKEAIKGNSPAVKRRILRMFKM